MLVAGMLIAAGGGDEQSASERFRDRVDDVCRDSNAELRASQAVLPANPTPDQAALFLGDVYVDLYRERINALRAVQQVPGDDADRYAQLVTDFEDVVDRIEADPARFVSVDPFAELNPRWEEFGTPACADPAQT
ncbi:MAG: hypothetical protein ACRD0G_19565 [Acidimicrobiales bacterium]